MAGPIFLLFFFTLPETQPTTILLHRAERLRKLTGNKKIRSQTEIDGKGISLGSTVREAIVKPLEITVKDPAIMFVNLYTALTYGIYYGFFEVFPIVYQGIYGFNVGETGLMFVCIVVGCILGISIHYSYLYLYLVPDILKNGLRAQEHRLVPACFATFGATAGLFLFGNLTYMGHQYEADSILGWTARESIHWFVPIIGITLYAMSCFILLQCIFSKSTAILL
jgi:MFS transporter, DHA1 family, multidrug resistance protein